MHCWLAWVEAEGSPCVVLQQLYQISMYFNQKYLRVTEWLNGEKILRYWLLLHHKLPYSRHLLLPFFWSSSMALQLLGTSFQFDWCFMLTSIFTDLFLCAMYHNTVLCKHTVNHLRRKSRLCLYLDKEHLGAMFLFILFLEKYTDGFFQVDLWVLCQLRYLLKYLVLCMNGSFSFYYAP